MFIPLLPPFVAVCFSPVEASPAPTAWQLGGGGGRRCGRWRQRSKQQQPLPLQPLPLQPLPLQPLPLQPLPQSGGCIALVQRLPSVAPHPALPEKGSPCNHCAPPLLPSHLSHRCVLFPTFNS